MTNKAQNEPVLLRRYYIRTYTVRRIRLNTYLTLHQYNYIYVQQKKELLVNLCDIVG